MVRSKVIAKLNDEQVYLYYFVIFLEFCTSVVAICSGGNLVYHISTGCTGFQFLGITVILIGVALLILFCVTCLLARRPGLAIAKSLLCSVPLVLVVLALGIFALVVSSQGGGESVPGRSYKEFRVESYSKWMQNKVKYNWENYYMKAVVKNKGLVCNNVAVLLGVDPAFKSGCCKPPIYCNFNYINQEVWAKPGNNSISNDTNVDCNRWDNDPNTLCFNCESCKAGFLEDVTSHWFTTGIGLVVIASIQLLMGVLCFMFSVDSSHQGYRRLLL